MNDEFEPMGKEASVVQFEAISFENYRSYAGTSVKTEISTLVLQIRNRKYNWSCEI
jgi:hypothetical protein